MECHCMKIASKYEWNQPRHALSSYELVHLRQNKAKQNKTNKRASVQPDPSKYEEYIFVFCFKKQLNRNVLDSRTIVSVQCIGPPQGTR